MTDDQQRPARNLIALTADLAAAFISHNPIGPEEVPALISSLHDTLAALAKPLAKDDEPAAPAPAVTVRKSLADPEFIVSMIDGKPYRTLKRHLGRHGLTPAEYRARYRLPNTYPMVAPAWSERRSAIAKAVGLGRKPKMEVAPPTVAQAAPPARRPRGRPKKVTTV